MRLLRIYLALSAVLPCLLFVCHEITGRVELSNVKWRAVRTLMAVI
jgi:hypothetical protein